MKILQKNISKALYALFLISIISFLTSCGPLKPKNVDLRKTPGNAAEKRAKNIQEGRGFSAMGAINNRGKGGNFQFASSNEMWRASLELLDFTTLHNVDYSGGIIVTDWFKENNKQDPLKITIRFLTNEIRADGIKVIIHKKKCSQGQSCRTTLLENSKISNELRATILEKAALLEKTSQKKN